MLYVHSDNYKMNFFSDAFYSMRLSGGFRYTTTYLSLYGYAADIRKLAKKIARSPVTVSCQGSDQILDSKIHQFMTEFDDNIGHMVVWLTQKPASKKVFGDRLEYPGFIALYSSMPETELATALNHNQDNIPDDIIDQVYNVIQKYTDVPCLREWVRYLLFSTWRAHGIEYIKGDSRNTAKVSTVGYELSPVVLINVIQEGLLSEKISMPDNIRRTSEYASSVKKFDDYLNTFSDELSTKVQDTFIPLFNPKETGFDEPVETYDAMAGYRKNIELLHDQKLVINAICKRLENHHSAIIVGSMGSGKTEMAIGAMYADNEKRQKKYTNHIVLCPGHLVNKWKREIQHSYPCAEVMICTGLSQFITDIEPRLKDKSRHTNLFIVVSKDTVKDGIEEQPMVHVAFHNKEQQHLRKPFYYCPVCGEHLEFKHSEGIDTFARKTKENSYCSHYKCGAYLWAPSIGEKSNYIKIPKLGWLHKKVIDYAYDNIYKDVNISSFSTKKERDLAKAILMYKEDETLYQAPSSRKYSLAKYIYRRYRNKIDYLVADEMHQYSGADSAQGKAFAILVRTAKHTIGLTGTLMNGYASNLFYLLFRMFPRMMVDSGYNYYNNKDFISEYGVLETKTMTIQKNSWYKEKAYSRTSERPGVSPVVFTDFLLNSCVFISLDYSAPYSEVPIGVAMPDDMREKYDFFREKVKGMISEELKNYSLGSSNRLNLLNTNTRNRMVVQAVNQLSMYPDQPFDMEPIYDEDTNQIAAKFQDIEVTDRVLPKEEKMLEIVKQAIDRGEHVLLYTHWTNKLDTQERLKDILIEHGYKADILTNNVTTSKRELWIRNAVENGIQVLICNPSLVETGLDLLDFTTIIWYQMGYNLTTMRQASKRSYRLNQKNPVHVYFLYYEDTAQEQVLAIMSLKLHAATALEGNFDSEGLAAMNADDTDILSQLAKSISENERYSVEEDVFQNTDIDEEDIKIVDNQVLEDKSFIDVFSTTKFRKRKKRSLKPTQITANSVCW